MKRSQQGLFNQTNLDFSQTKLDRTRPRKIATTLEQLSTNEKVRVPHYHHVFNFFNLFKFNAPDSYSIALPVDIGQPFQQMNPIDETISTNAEFFLVALPGLEDIVLSEVLDWFPSLEPKVEHGGIKVEAPLAIGLAMNLALKTPTRILVRISTFTCRDFPKLFQKISAIPWRHWIDLGCNLEVHASTNRSRLKMKKRIEETGAKAWRSVQKKSRVVQSEKKAALYIRIADNICTLSLDTSGERLHKRGLRQHVGEAPLRETIAAALLQLLSQHGKGCSDVELVDPMMGSGVFLLEAAFRDRLIEAREFGFESFAQLPAQVHPISTQRPKFSKLIGFEKDFKTAEAAKFNLQTAQSETTILQEDFFEAKPLPRSQAQQRWVVINPPYGERLKIKGPLSQFYAKIFATVERVVQPDLACFLLPAKVGRLDLPRSWKIVEKRSFSNGGIPVIAFVFRRVQVEQTQA
jgi:putative N6-adenine-specific DNA methylase